AEQRGTLEEIITDALHFLENQNNTKPFEESLQEAINIIWVNLSQLEEGDQKAARTFQCETCRVVDCQYPVDCPVQDLWAHADEAITMDCSVPFAIPPDKPITWLFAKDLHTQDLSVFEELRGIQGDPVTLTLHDPTPGTIACCRGFLSEPLARKYFYVNVTGGSVEAERGIQERFRAVLRWPQHRIPPDYMKPLVLFLALGSMAVVVLLVSPMIPTPGWPKDCSELPAGSPSGVYIIQPPGLHPITVPCEAGGTDGGWTVVQRNRQSTGISWAESWSTYKHGFGNVHTEFWLGTEYIHQITQQKVYQVRFLIWDASNNMHVADYSLFSVEDESQGYRLRLGTYSGTAGDAMDSKNPRKVHNNMKFSTKDRDQDTYRGNCASRYGGGWWFSACYSAQLNVLSLPEQN
ncbi:PREDICTED: tenascin-N-like, partial [Chaetura pelagica]|uniref:tenascin-N-like n=1 Tax=Chaetura pelagica TaxID=8897 RepID=UPI0005237AC0